MTTLYDATLAVAQALGEVHQGTLTGNGMSGGFVTQLQDSKLSAEQKKHFDKGTLWVVNNAVNTTRTLAYDAVNGLTFDELPAAMVVGQAYYMASPRYPQHALRAAVNQALQDYGPILKHKLVTVVEGQFIYAETAEMLTLETESAAGESDWKAHFWWGQRAGEILIDTNHIPAAGSNMRLGYLGAHDTLTADSGIVDGEIEPTRLKWAAAALVIRWRMANVRSDEPQLKDQLNEATARAQAAAMTHPKRHVPQIKMARY